MTRCPMCARDLVPVVYGYPDPSLVDAERRGEVRLGGCEVWPAAQELACPNGCRLAGVAGTPSGVRDAWLLTWNPDHYSPDPDWLLSAQETTRRGGTVAED